MIWKRAKFRNWVITIILTAVFILGNGCMRQTAQKENGVVTVRDKTCYIVKMAAGRSVKSYFTLTGEHGMVVCEYLGNMDQNINMGTVYFSEVSVGGWVAYMGDRMMYMPADFDKDDAQFGASVLTMHYDNYMAFPEAEKYIP